MSAEDVPRSAILQFWCKEWVNAMKIIKSARQLPEWFGLEKYDGVSQFELADWWAAFSLRHYVGVTCEVPDDAEGPSWHLLTDDGRLSPVKAWARITQYGSAAHVGFWYNPFHHGNSSVESISVQDFFHIAKAIGEMDDNKYRLAFDAFEAEVEADANTNTDRSLADRIGGAGISPNECLLENAHDALDPHAYWLHHVAFAQIDLLASDATIENNFSVWLRDVRRRHQHVTFKRERRYSSRDAMNWANSGVLPYLDLSIWAELEGVEISDSVYGDAIFGPNRLINVTEAVRKVTAPLAERIWTGELPNSLESDLSGRVLES